jgi:PAS domain S-box-containing protein
MTTIISAMILTGQSPRLMDFISILAVGTIGFVSVYFSLQYSRQLDEQRQQLLALYTTAEAMNRVVELDVVLQTALSKITDLLNTPFGWVYMLDGQSFALTTKKGTTLDFFTVSGEPGRPASLWLHQPRVQRELLEDPPNLISREFKMLGVQFWASIPLRIKDEAIGILVVAGGAYDIFSEKQAELLEAFGNQISVALTNAQLFERLKESEQQYIDLFEHAPDIYLTIDRSQTIVACNKTGAGMLGYPREEMIDKPFAMLFIEEGRGRLTDTVDRMFANGQGLKDVEERMKTEAGKRIFVNLNSSLVFDETGSIINARIVARDISERKMMEGALQHAQKIDSIGNLAGGIAHDFNNILSAILGSASIMRRRLTEKAKLYKYVEIIESSARRGSSLTRQLLTFARKTETTVKPVNINELIRDTLHLFQRSVTREIVVRTSFTDDGAVTNGDDGQIQQAILNLFLNARDAMPDGGKLSVSTRIIVADARTASQFSSVRPGPFVQITVTDTGQGISQEIQNRIFEPFFTTKDHGTGLGLSVVYGVIQGHGGFVNMESAPARGTTFSVYLPRVSASTQGAGPQRPKRLPHGQENILIIDDELSVCEIARDMLTGLGYTVYTEHDGKAGVEYYKTRQASIDLILLDINMPVMSGKDAFERLRSLNPRVRIIIVTGYGKAVIETSSFSSEVNGFMQKPFQLESLSLTVRNVLDRQPIHIESSA